MEISFREKKILVTGAGRGIGREIAKKLSQCGAQVFALSKTKSNLDSLSKEEPLIKTVCVDMSDWGATKEALERLPPLDGLVNNAAVALLGPFLEAREEDFDTIFNINVKSVLNVSQVIAKKMIENKKSGAIVNVSSQASMAGLRNHALYCGTKGALDAMSRVMAMELGAENIRVNCVNPTVVMTEMGRLGWSDPSKAQTMLSKIPLGRFAEVEEVVDAVLFLLSDRAAMINGVALPIDGGFLAGHGKNKRIRKNRKTTIGGRKCKTRIHWKEKIEQQEKNKAMKERKRNKINGVKMKENNYSESKNKTGRNKDKDYLKEKEITWFEGRIQRKNHFNKIKCIIE